MQAQGTISSVYYSSSELYKMYPSLFKEEICTSFEHWAKELESAEGYDKIILSLFKICIEEKEKLITPVSEHVYSWINKKIEERSFFKLRPVEISMIACKNLSLTKSKIPLSIKECIFPSEYSSETIATEVAIFPLIAHSPVFLSLLSGRESELRFTNVRRDLLLNIITLINDGLKVDITRYFGKKNAEYVFAILAMLKIPVDLIEEKGDIRALPERCSAVEDLVRKLQRATNASDSRTVSTIESIIKSMLKHVEVEKDWDYFADWIDVATFHSAEVVIEECLNILLTYFDELYGYFKVGLKLGNFYRLLKQLSSFVTEIKESVWSKLTEENLDIFVTLFGKNLQAISLSSKIKLSIDDVISRFPDTVREFSFLEAEKFSNAHLKLLSQRCPNLISLELESPSIKDLTNLQFVHLRKLLLKRAKQLKNIDGLSKLPLVEVTISGSRIDNFCLLAKVSDLSKVCLQDSLNIDVSFSKDLLHLKEVDISGSQQVVNLARLPESLTVLNIERAEVVKKDIEALEERMRGLRIKK